MKKGVSQLVTIGLLVGLVLVLALAFFAFRGKIFTKVPPQVSINPSLSPSLTPSDTVSPPTAGFSAAVTVDANDVLHKQNPLLIGDNIHWVFTSEGLDESKNDIQDFYDLSTYAKEAGLKLLRFPGGSIADAYHWKNHVGPVESRPSGNPQGNPNGRVAKSLIGTDEFMRFTELVGSQAIFVVNFGTGTPDEAADWVEYLNTPNDGRNPRGGTDWAAERSKNGRNEPYGVKYFEVGNEIYAGMKQNTFFGHVGVEEYATKYNEFVAAMKEVDQTILTGAVGYAPNKVSPQDEKLKKTVLWNQKLMEIAGKNIDFVIEHSYAYGEASDVMVEQGTYKEASIKEIARFGLAYVYYQIDLLSLIQKETGSKPFAITEHGSPFSSDYLSALIMGSYLIETLKRQDVLLAPSFNLFEMNPHDASGVIYGHILVNQKNVLQSTPYPIYYALKAFGKYTGDQILNAGVTSPTYDIPSFVIFPAKDKVPLVSVLASKNAGVVYLAVLNRDLDRSVDLRVNLKNFVAKTTTLHQLYSERLLENNEGSLNIELKSYDASVSGDSFSLTLPKHSLTIIELKSA